MTDLVKIPSASAEYVAKFDRPYIGLLTNDRPLVFERIVSALLPFKFQFSNIEVVNTDIPADNRVIFKLPDRGITFQFRAEDYKFSKDGSSWATAPDDALVWLAAEDALLTASGAKVGSSQITFAMHLQPLSKSREQVLAPFLPGPFKSILGERRAQTFGCQVRFDDGCDVLIDYSLAFANGIFLRLTSNFEGHPTQDQILSKVRGDQEEVFRMLDIQEASTDND